MIEYLVSAEHSIALSSAVRELGGKPFHHCWIVPSDSADQLALRLRIQQHPDRRSFTGCDHYH